MFIHGILVNNQIVRLKQTVFSHSVDKLILLWGNENSSTIVIF